VSGRFSRNPNKETHRLAFVELSIEKSAPTESILPLKVRKQVFVENQTFRHSSEIRHARLAVASYGNSAGTVALAWRECLQAGTYLEASVGGGDSRKTEESNGEQDRAEGSTGSQAAVGYSSHGKNIMN